MAEHCCEMMARNVDATCDRHPNRYDCPDCVIDFWRSSKSYGIMIHDGGTSMIAISYCPWCGANLRDEA